VVFFKAIGMALAAISVYLAFVFGSNFFAGLLPERSAEKMRVVIFVAPAILALTIGLVIPGLRTLLLAFFDNSGDAKSFVGLDNFRWVLKATDEGGGRGTLINNVFWVLVVPIMSTAIGLLVALLADKYRGEAVAKALIFLPNAISLAGAGIVWKFVYAYRPEGQEQIGLLNKIITSLGGSPRFFLIDNKPFNNLFLMFVMVWVQVGFATVVLSAAIKGVAADFLEAARMDGATERQVFWRILLPSIRPTVIVVLTTITIAVLKAFDVVKAMTGGQFETDVVASAMMNQTFSNGKFGYGAALATILFVAVIPIMYFNLKQFRSEQAGR
jgi:alpha-glucoside transport system permease protein